MTWRSFRQETGSVTIIVALVMPFLLAGLALAVETGIWFMAQRKLQHGADAAAYSAAVSLASGLDTAQVLQSAQHAAIANGLSSDRVQIDISFPVTGRVQIVAREERNFLLLRAVDYLYRDGEPFFDGTQRIGARAVAEVFRGDHEVAEERSLPVCIMALAPQRIGMELGGTSSLTVPDCSIEVHSSGTPAISIGGSGRVSASCVTTNGTIDGVGAITTDPDFCEEPRQRRTPRPLFGPLATIIRPTNLNTVPNDPLRNNESSIIASHITHPSGVPMRRFHGGLALGRGTYTFQPGLYIIDGGQFSTSNGTIINADQGVAFYLTGGAYVNFHSGTISRFRGMRSGPWQNFVFFDGSDAPSAQTHTLVTSSLDGLVFLPRATFEFSGGQTVGEGCFILVAASFRFIGNARVVANCANTDIDFDPIRIGDGDGENESDQPVEDIRLVE